MFPLSHIYVSSQVLGRNTPLLALGSIIPDIAWASKGRISREKVHDSPEKLYAFIAQNHPSLLDFACGMVLHTGVGKGADYYSDNRKDGFAIVEGRKILADIHEMVPGFSEDLSLSGAHNFIEAAVDFHLSKTKPELVESLRQLENNSHDEIIIALSEFLGMEKEVTESCLDSFFRFMNPVMYGSKEEIIKRLARITMLRFGKEPDPEKVFHIFEKSLGFIQENYLEYLDNAATEMKITFKGKLK